MFVYILRCADKSLYTGISSDPAERERAHNEARGGRFTAIRRPVSLVYTEVWPTLDAAVRRERQLKRWSAKKEALVGRNFELLHSLSRRRT